MKHVGLDDVVELFGLADPVGHRKLAVREQRGKNGSSGIGPGTATISQPVRGAAIR